MTEKSYGPGGNKWCHICGSELCRSIDKHKEYKKGKKDGYIEGYEKGFRARLSLRVWEHIKKEIGDKK